VDNKGLKLETNILIQLTISFALILFGWLLKRLSVRCIKNRAIKNGLDRRYLVNNVRNFINLIILACLLALWSSELQRFALSIAAFIVAIVLATKEFIQCLIGFLYLTSSAPFRVGDWVQIDDQVGEVTEADWLKTTLLEINLEDYSYSGKSIFIPNSQLVTRPIQNMNFMKRYVTHSFVLTVELPPFDPYSLKSALIQKAKHYCADFSEVAERYNALIENRLDIRISGPEPTLDFNTTDLGKLQLVFNIFCPTEQAKRIERLLTKDFFGLWMKKQLPTAKK